MQDIGLTGNQTVFINTSLCPYYGMLWSKRKSVHELTNITNFYIASGTIKFKITDSSSLIAIICNLCIHCK